MTDTGTSATAAINAARMMQDLRAIAPFAKQPGTAGERASLNYLAQGFREVGFSVRLIEHDAYISMPGSARLTLGTTGEIVTCITHSFSRATPAHGIEAGCVQIGDPTPANFSGKDVRGKFVILNGLASPNAAHLASAAGALGQIHVMPYEYRHEMCISNVWGSPDEAQLDTLPSTVVVTVNQEDGERIIASTATGGLVHVAVEIDAGWRKTPILEAELMPEGQPDSPYILFSGHHDTWYEGVMDNGAANITMLEVARLVALQRAAMRRGLRLCVWSGHSQGRYSGSAWYADEYWHDLQRRCLVHVNVDSTGGQGNTVLVDMSVAAELYGFAAASVRRVSGQELVGRRMSRAGDQSFSGIGIPAMFMTTGEQPAGSGPNVTSGFLGSSGPARAGAGFGYWWHTEHDLIERIDPDLLVRDTAIYADTVTRLLTGERLPLDFATWARAFDAHIAGFGDHDPQTGAWIAGLRRLAGELESAALAFDAREIPQSRRDAVLQGIAHQLVPVDYTSGNRYQPDPALIAPAYPALEPLRRLQFAAASGAELRHMRVSARRAVNLVTDSLRAACDLLADRDGDHK